MSKKLKRRHPMKQKTIKQFRVKYGNCPRSLWCRSPIHNHQLKAGRLAWRKKHPFKCTECNFRFTDARSRHHHEVHCHYDSTTSFQNSNKTGRVNSRVSLIGDEVNVVGGKYTGEKGALIQSFSNTCCTLKLRDGTVTRRVLQTNLRPVFLVVPRDTFAWLRLTKLLPSEVIFHIQTYIAGNSNV